MSNIEFFDPTDPMIKPIEDFLRSEEESAEEEKKQREAVEAINLLTQNINGSVIGLFQRYEDSLDINAMTGDVILGGRAPLSPEYPEDLVDVTLVSAMSGAWGTTTLVVDGRNYKVSPSRVWANDGANDMSVNRQGLETLSFMLEQRDPVAKYSEAETTRLANQWRESQAVSE